MTQLASSARFVRISRAWHLGGKPDRQVQRSLVDMFIKVTKRRDERPFCSVQMLSERKLEERASCYIGYYESPPVFEPGL